MAAGRLDNEPEEWVERLCTVLMPEASRISGTRLTWFIACPLRLDAGFWRPFVSYVRTATYLWFWLDVSAAIFSSWLTSSSSSLAFLACPPRSNSLACCAAMTFS